MWTLQTEEIHALVQLGSVFQGNNMTGKFWASTPRSPVRCQRTVNYVIGKCVVVVVDTQLSLAEVLTHCCSYLTRKVLIWPVCGWRFPTGDLATQPKSESMEQLEQSDAFQLSVMRCFSVGSNNWVLTSYLNCSEWEQRDKQGWKEN